MNGTQQIVYRKHTFLSAVAMGLSSVIIVCVLCCTGLIIFSMHFAGSQAGKLVSVATGFIDGAPDILKALPPLVGDVLNDRRVPSYSGQLEVTAQMLPGVDGDGARLQFQVTNNGDRLVTLLTVRTTLINADGRTVGESNHWAATPIAADRDWRGPLMPKSSRRFACPLYLRDSHDDTSGLKVEAEITDVRVWTEVNETPGPAGVVQATP